MGRHTAGSSPVAVDDAQPQQTADPAARLAPEAGSTQSSSSPTSDTVSNPTGTTTDSATTEHDDGSNSWRRVVAIAGGVALLVALILTAFAYPGTNAAPHHVPIGVVGPEQAVTQLGTGLEQNAGADGFDLSAYDSREAAVAAIEDREVYGAIVLGRQGGQMLTAAAGSPAVAQILGQVASGIPAQAGGPLEVSEIVALPSDDARGAAIPSAMLPLIVGGIAAAAVSFLMVRGSGRQVLTVVCAAVVTAPAMTLVLQTWLNALDGSFTANASVLALGLSAVALTVLGLSRLLGIVGISVGALLMMFVGNPLSGATSAPELLPAGWGVLGQLVPPGAASQLLRSSAFFDGAAATGPIVVLTGWALLGLVLVAVGHRRADGARAT